MITGIFTWSILLSIFLLLGLAAYKLFMEKSGLTAYNHAAIAAIYILGILTALLLLIPGSDMHIEIGAPTAIGAVGTATAEGAAPTATAWHHSLPYLWEGAAAVYLLGLLLMLGRIAISCRKMKRLAAESIVSEVRGIEIRVHSHSGIVPCSFGGMIFVPDTLTGRELEMAVCHENAHCRRHHWAEHIAAEIVTAFNWFNPGAYILRDCLRDIHEYEADSAVVREGYPRADYQMLLIRTAVGQRFDLLANNLNNSSLKIRITMMHNNPTSRLGAAMRALALIPSLAAAFAIAAMLPVNAMTTPDNDPATTSVSTLTGSYEASSPAAPAADEATEKVYARSEVLPAFEGGEAELMNWVAKNIVYPKDVKLDKKVRVIVKFVIKADGTVGDFEFMRKSDIEALNQAAVKAIESTSGKWTPGSVDGKPVNVAYMLPVTFSQTSDSDKK